MCAIFVSDDPYLYVFVERLTTFAYFYPPAHVHVHFHHFFPLSSENLVINWPDGAEDDIADEGKEIVEHLLQHNPEERLGSSSTGGQYKQYSSAFYYSNPNFNPYPLFNDYLIYMYMYIVSKDSKPIF